MTKTKPVPPPLEWYSPVFSYQGYAHQSRQLLHGLASLGWVISLTPADPDTGLPIDHGPFIRSLAKSSTPLDRAPLTLSLIPAPAEPFNAQRTVLFTMLESQDAHPLYALRAAQYHDIIVPCEFNLRALLNAGIPARRLHIVPSGYDPDTFYPSTIDYDYDPNSHPRFLVPGTWQARKNQIGTVAELAAACASAGRGSIHVHTNLGHAYGPDIASYLNLTHYAFLSGFDRDMQDRIVWHTTALSPRQVGDLYRTMDYVVSMSRGEAWNLPLLEAMACGAVPIFHNAHAHKCWIKPRTGFPIPTKRPLDLATVEPLLIDHYKGCTFLEPDLDELARTAHFLVAAWNRCHGVPSFHRRHIRRTLRATDHLTWHDAAVKLAHTLNQIHHLKSDNLTALDIMRSKIA